MFGPQGVGWQGSVDWRPPSDRWPGPPPNRFCRMTGDTLFSLGGQQPSTGLGIGMKPATQLHIGLPWLLTEHCVFLPHGEGWQVPPGF